jgi:virulence-associated protein VagC
MLIHGPINRRENDSATLTSTFISQRPIQAVRIPKDFEMDCDEAIIRKEGNKFVLEPVKKDGFLNILMSLEPIKETFPDVDESWMIKWSIFTRKDYE